MNRTEQIVRKTLAAIDAPYYDLGTLTDRGMFLRMEALSSSQCLNRLRYLTFRNAHGAHIYFRPSGERCFTLLDDLDQTAMSKMRAEGFEPCAIVETSPGNFQAWLKHTHVLPKPLGTLAAQILAHRYGADPSAADWRRFGRLPGFTNRKPKHRNSNGLFPFVRLHFHTGQQFTNAARFENEVVSLYRAREMERLKKRQSFRPWTGRAVNLCLPRFRASLRYQGRSAAADMAFSIAALANGWSDIQVADALSSEYLSRDPSPSRRSDYVRRTIAKALLWSRRSCTEEQACR